MPRDPQKMYHVAAQFLMAAHRCINKQSLGGRPPEVLDIPAIVNVSFAAEVLIKALLQMEGKLEERAGHKLATLFEQLPEKHKSHIRVAVEREFDQFQERLESISDSFKSWRYVYEEEFLILANHRFLHKFTHTTADHVAACLNIDPRVSVPLTRSTS